jgi:methionine sulfoxide reductase heme-binding subunit
MSTAYSAVGWNRQKKIYDKLIALFCATYLLLFISLTLIFNSEVTFETLLIRSTSTLAVLLLHVILAIGPLTRLNKKFLPFLYNRRHLGVTMFCMAAVHGIFSIIQFHGLSNTNPIASVLISNTNFGSIPAFPFLVLGLLALIIFFLMAITSHDFWLHNLSPIVWKSLHMLVYVAYVLVVLHVMLGVIQLEKNPVFVIILFLGSSFLIVMHLLAALKERRIDKQKFPLIESGYVYVCEADEIKDNRAKIFCVNEERVAVYRFDNKLYAVHNVCKHQGGPLGEGKIIDGCITCPWHGYQYLPQNGQSPPPFKEKVSTYQVRVIENKVWLNPKPFAEGTEQEGADL